MFSHLLLFTSFNLFITEIFMIAEFRVFTPADAQQLNLVRLFAFLCLQSWASAVTISAADKG